MALQNAVGRRGFRFVDLVSAVVLAAFPWDHAFADHTVSCAGITAPPAAIFLYGGSTNATFNGNDFVIDGNDVKYTDGLPGPMSAVWGIAARSEDGADELRGSLNSSQKNNVQGLGYQPGAPAIPSIGVVGAPTSAAIDRFIADLLSSGPVNVHTSSSINGSPVFGTEAAPQITYLSNATGVTFGNGNARGYGVLIVEHSLTLSGNFEFIGLVVVRGPVIISQVTGSTLFWGSLWTTEFSLTVGGHVAIQYSSLGLQAAVTAGAARACEPVPTPTGPTPIATPTESATRAVTPPRTSTPAATRTLTPPSTVTPSSPTTPTVRLATATSTPDATATPACGPAPAESCRTPTTGGASVTLRDRLDDAKDALAWRWKSADASTIFDFADPTTTTSYDLCVYEATKLVLAASMPAAGVCSSKPCWTPTSRGFEYRNPSRLPDGVQQLTLAVDGGLVGQGTIRLKARGLDLDMPVLPLTVPVRAQLRNTEGTCWEVVIDTPRGNDARKFVGRSD